MPLTTQQQIAALQLLQEVAGAQPTWDTVTAAVSQAAEAQGQLPEVAALMGQAAAHQMGLRPPRRWKGKPRGGARRGAGRKPYPDMALGGIVIQVSDYTGTVSRWVRVGVAFRLQPADNCVELEEAAETEIAAIGGDIAISGIYPCSPALGKLARWI